MSILTFENFCKNMLNENKIRTTSIEKWMDELIDIMVNDALTNKKDRATRNFGTGNMSCGYFNKVSDSKLCASYFDEFGEKIPNEYRKTGNAIGIYKLTKYSVPTQWDYVDVKTKYDTTFVKDEEHVSRFGVPQFITNKLNSVYASISDESVKENIRMMAKKLPLAEMISNGELVVPIYVPESGKFVKSVYYICDDGITLRKVDVNDIAKYFTASNDPTKPKDETKVPVLYPYVKNMVYIIANGNVYDGRQSVTIATSLDKGEVDKIYEENVNRSIDMIRN